MIMMRTPVAVALLFLIPAAVSAQVVDKFHITPEEHAACDTDAYRLCSDSQDQDQVLACMKAHRHELTPTCLGVFDAGLKRRHMRS